MTQPSVNSGVPLQNVDRRFVVSVMGAAVVATALPASAATAPSDLTWMPGWKIRDGIVSGQFTALEVTEHFLSRIGKLDPTLHAFRLFNIESAREQAKAADEAIRSGKKPGLLHGIPIAVKEHFAVRGFPSPRHGHSPSENVAVSMAPAKEDSIVAERLRGAGAIIVGVTIQPGMGIDPGMPDLANHPRNPWNPEHVPGSSSAGSAAAVSSGMLPICIGGDGGGSTRLPAALCGVIGLHPTTGRVPNSDYTSTRLMLTGTIGPITRDIRDAAITLQAIAGPDGRDMLSTAHSFAPDYSTQLAKGIKGMMFGWTDDFGFASKYFTPESAAIIAQTHEAANGFRALGAEVSSAKIDLEDFWPHVAHTMYHYEGKPQPEPVMRAAMEARGRNRVKFDALLRAHDFILSTTIPFTAPTVEQWDKNWKDGVSFAPVYTSETFMFNWIGLPAISIPIGLYKGMPIGLQIIGRPDSEPRMFAAAAAFLKKFPQNARPKIS
jgi:aspartyl-tRNA(Asn)/glutamyl-tRNA(Gln) amidotransferase subunit A